MLAILSVIVFAWSLSAVFNFYSSKEQVEELFDAELAQMGRILQSVMTKQVIESSPSSLNYLDKEVLTETFGQHEFTIRGHKYEKKLAFQVWDAKGQLFFENTSSLPKEFGALNRGYENIVAQQGQWRTFTLKDETFGFWVITAQREDVRTELTSEIAINTVIPNLIMLPVLVFLIALLIRKGLSPLNEVSNALKKRGYQNLEQIPASEYPVELRYLVGELNELFMRVSEASERERRFTADAAHELRTPLSISKVHLQNIMQISQSEQVKDFVGKALVGIDRLIHMVQQLLVLSRLDAQQEQEITSPVQLNTLIHSILDDLKHQGILAHKSVFFETEKTITWQANDAQMHILLRNLLDNACRYADNNTQISIFLDSQCLIIRNVCAAMPDAMLTLCMGRFKRGVTDKEGSGLGLSICQQICQQNHYAFSMRNRLDGVEGVEVLISKP